MVSPAVRASHCSGVKNLAKVLVPGDDVVEHVGFDLGCIQVTL